jgi:DNA adenine methylase
MTGLTLHPRPWDAIGSISNIKPLYRWAGGKTKLLKAYRDLIPDYAGYDAYVEPFFGGGAVFCNVISSSMISRLFINDINPELCHMLNTIGHDPATFSASVAIYRQDFIKQGSEAAGVANYHRFQKLYWDAYDKHTSKTGAAEPNVKTAALLYVLMSLSFGGIYKTTIASNGKFGTSINREFARWLGNTAKVKAFDPQHIRNWAAALQYATVSTGSYLTMKLPTTGRALIFCDPPYRGAEIDYANGFNDNDQLELVAWCKSQAAKGHTVLLANSVNDSPANPTYDPLFFQNAIGEAGTLHLIEGIKHSAGTLAKGKATRKDGGEFLAIFKPPLAPLSPRTNEEQAAINSWIGDLNEAGAP